MLCENKYVTLLDLARQSKIITGDTACFAGKIQAGIPFSGYPTGVNTATTVSLGIVSSESSIFNTCSADTCNYCTMFDIANTGSTCESVSTILLSGETCGGVTGMTCPTIWPPCALSAMTNFNPKFSGYTNDFSWTSFKCLAGTTGLTTPITSLSADTQVIGPIWGVAETGFNGEHLIALKYTGYTLTYSFWDITPYLVNNSGCLFNADTGSTCDGITGFTSGVTSTTICYSGFTTCTRENFSAGTLDYKGPIDYLRSREDGTIDNLLVTNKLRVRYGASSATTNYVLMQIDDIGTAEWMPISATSADTNMFVTGGTISGTSQDFDGPQLLLFYNNNPTGTTTDPIDLSELNLFVSGGTLSGTTLWLEYNSDNGTADPIDLSALSGGTFSGNTSASCITDLFVTNIHGCSPITFHSPLQHVGSSATGLNSIAWGSGNTTVDNFSSILGGQLNSITGNSAGCENNTIIGGSNNTMSDFGSATSDNNTILGGLSNTMTARSIRSAIIGGTSNIIGVSGGTTANAVIVGGNSNVFPGLTPPTNSVILGGTGITGLTANTAYVPTLNIDTTPIEENTLTDVLVRDSADGIVKQRDIGTIVFSGGSGNCITDLYITNRHGCSGSTITEYDPIQHISSSATGILSIAWGSGTTASGGGSHAEGLNTIASGDLSHAEGNTTIASGGNSHTEGGGVIAAGLNSHAGGEGFDVNNRIIASGKTSFVHFDQTTASGIIGAYGDNSAILGGREHNIGTGSTSSGIFVGSGNTISEDVGASVIIGGIDNTIEVVTGDTCGCPCGYEYNIAAGNCIKLTATTITPGGVIVAAVAVSSYGNRGARFCIPGAYTTCGGAGTSPNWFDTGPMPFWGDGVAPHTDGRLNTVGVNNAAMIASDDWFGFSECFELPSDGQYLIGMAGDNRIRATINGVQIVENPWDGSPGSTFNFRYWWVWPLDLKAGKNNIILEGANQHPTTPAAFGCEIVGPFPHNTFTDNSDFEIFSATTGMSAYTANTVFSSLDTIGDTFDTEVNKCPADWVYNGCVSGCSHTIGCHGGSSVIVGGTENTILYNSPHSGIFGGYNNIIDSSSESGIIGGCSNYLDEIERSVVLGGANITGITADTVYVPNLNISYPPSNDNSLTQVLVRDIDGTVKYADAAAIGGSFSGNTSGSCIDELWVSAISGCSDLHIGTNGNMHLQTHSGSTTGHTSLFINEDGQIGIGTTTPFDWITNSGRGIEIHNDSVNDKIPLALTEVGTRRWYLETDFATTFNPVHLKGSSDVNLMTWFTSSSKTRLGIGTTVPVGTVHISRAGTVADQTKYPAETNIVINNTSSGVPNQAAFRFDHQLSEKPGGLIASVRTPQWDDGSVPVSASTTLEFWNSSGGTLTKRIEINPYGTGSTGMVGNLGNLEISGNTVVSNNYDGTGGITIVNYSEGGDATPVMNLIAPGLNNKLTSATILYAGANWVGNGTFQGEYIVNSLNIATGSGGEVDRANINIGSRRGSDAQTRFFGGSSDFTQSSLLGVFFTSGLTISDTTNTDNLRVRDGATTGYVLMSDDNLGNASWQPSGPFTGNTSGDCITDLFVTNIHGCSPITIHDPTQHISSSATGINSIAWGSGTTASGDYSHAEGLDTIAASNGSHAEGWVTEIDDLALFAHAEGAGTYVGEKGIASHAEGILTKALQTATHAEGSGTTANGHYSHAQGFGSMATGVASHAEGYLNSAVGIASHAEGTSTMAWGDYSHAEGENTIASGTSAHAAGLRTIARGDYSHASGYNPGGGDSIFALSIGSFVHQGPPEAAGSAGIDNDSPNSTILGGIGHNIYGTSGNSGIIGGAENIISACSNSVIVGGGGNQIIGDVVLATSSSNTIIGGSGNDIIGSNILRSAIIGGFNNIIGDGIDDSVIIGGANITASKDDTVYVPTLNIDSAVQDNTVTEVLVRAGDGTVQYRDAATISGCCSTAGSPTPEAWVGIINFNQANGGDISAGDIDADTVDATTGRFTHIDSASPLLINNTDQGNVYIGSNSGFTYEVLTSDLTILGEISTQSLTVVTGAASDYVLVSDASGLCTWTAPEDLKGSTNIINVATHNCNISPMSTTANEFSFGQTVYGWSSQRWGSVNLTLIGGGTDDLLVENANVGIPLPDNLVVGDEIKVCGNIYHDNLAAGDGVGVCLGVFTCNDWSLGPPDYQVTEVATALPVVPAFKSKVVCGELLSYTVTAPIQELVTDGCSSFFVLGFSDADGVAGGLANAQASWRIDIIKKT